MTFDYGTLWITLGVVILICEMLTGTFVLLFMALGCFAAGLVAFLNLSILGEGGVANLAGQLVVCAVVTVIGLALLRKPIKKKFLSGNFFEGDIGKEIEVTEEIPAQQSRRIRYQGSSWEALNVGSELINPNDRVTIVGVDGNSLQIRSLKKEE